MKHKCALLLAALVTVSLVTLPIGGPVPAADARTGTYTLAMIQASYSDAVTHPYTLAQLRDAATEMAQYIAWMSNGQLTLDVRVGAANLDATVGSYFDACQPAGSEPRQPCPPPLMEDAAQSAAANGLDFSGVDGIMLLSPLNRDVTFGPIRISRPGVNGTFQQSYDYEGTSAPTLHTPGPSGVLWNGWAHELGHQLQIADGTALGGRWNGHPSGYSSGYDLMDSGYPDSESVYGLSRPDIGTKSVFPDWLPASKVQTVPPPILGPTTTSVTLAPLSRASQGTADRQGVKVTIAPGVYYVLEARARERADSLNVGPGVYDEGVHILYVAEQADPPVTPIDSCDTTVPGGCVRSRSDSRSSNCPTRTPTAADAPAYCWPYPLWKPGQTYDDRSNAIQITVDAFDGGSGTYRVTVTRGVPLGRPDVSVTPWLTPPMNTWETKDIWVDSSCNGYETDVGPRGLRYGRRDDGTVIGNGDDPCANHENRVYVRVHNNGTAPATNVSVSLNATDPLGVGIRGARGWTGLGTVTPVDFPGLASIPAGGFVDVYQTWTPTVDLTNQPAIGRFAFHSCVQVIINPPPGDLVFDNTDGDGEQENFDSFEAVLDSSGGYMVPEHDLYLSNIGMGLEDDGQPRTFRFDAQTDLPEGWSFKLGDDQAAVTLGPKETLAMPVRIQVPAGTPLGKSFSLSVAARTEVVMHNDAIPDGGSAHPDHHAGSLVAGVALDVRTMEPGALTLTATHKDGDVAVEGHLDPARPDEILTLDYLTGDGEQISSQVITTADGTFTDFQKSSKAVQVRAIWQGNLDHASTDTTVDVT